LNAKQIDLLKATSNGSPLFTESLLRLYRDGTPFKKAIRDWQGKDGNEVRKAALLHEIERLSMEAKRVLLATAYMGDTSLTELRQVTGYDQSRMQKFIGELKAFFLIETKPLIRKEARFAVSDNIGRITLENASKLVLKPDQLQATIKKYRQRQITSIGQKRISTIDAAILQARAMKAEDNYKDAISTLESAIVDYKNDKNLLLEYAVSLYENHQLSKNAADLDKARSNFQKSYNAGQRKELLFVRWYEAEREAKDYNSAIEVASLALPQSNPRCEWLKKRASVYAQLSRSLANAYNVELQIDNMKKAADDIALAFVEADDVQRLPLEEVLYGFDDELWTLCRRNSVREIPTYKDLFDLSRSFIKHGDKRIINFERLTSVIKEAFEYLDSKSKASPGVVNLLQNLLKEAHDCYKQESQKIDKGTGEHIEQNLKALDYKMQKIIEKFRKA
jgi:hypothetical protein